MYRVIAMGSRMKILDAHAHVSADPASAPRLLATMDAAGIARRPFGVTPGGR